MKNQKLLTRVAIFIGLLVFISGCAALRYASGPSEILLRFKLTPTETLKYTTVLQGSGNTQVIRPDQPEFNRKVNFTQRLQFSQTTSKIVKDPNKKEADFYQVTLQYDDIAVEVAIDGEKKPRISKNIETAKLSLIKRPITYLKSGRGVIKRVEGFNTLVSEFMKKKPIGEEQDVVVSTGILRSIGQFVQRAVSQNVRSFPEKPVKVGNSWRDEVIQDIPFMGEIKSTYTGKLVGFEKINNKLCVKIRYTHEMASVRGHQKQFGGIGFSQKIKGKGYHYLSVEGNQTAYLVKTTGEVTSELEMIREVTFPDGRKAPVKSIARMKLKSTLDLVD